MQIVGGLGGILILVGWIWLVVIAFQTSGAIWGILNIFLQPVMGIIYAIVNKTGWLQVALMLIGWLMLGAGFGTSLISQLGL